MKALGSYLFAVVVTLLALAAVAPALVGLSHALLPLVIVLGVVIIGVKLTIFHTRRW
jgi:hypothetical protein